MIIKKLDSSQKTAGSRCDAQRMRVRLSGGAIVSGKSQKLSKGNRHKGSLSFRNKMIPKTQKVFFHIYCSSKCQGYLSLET